MSEASKPARGRPRKPARSIPVKVATSPALHAHLWRLVDFGWGLDPADVLRSLAEAEVRRLQKAGKLPYEP